MDNNQKKIEFKISSSVDLSLYSIEKLEGFWYQELELIYVLSGAVNVRCRDIEYNLYEDDIILINMFDMHSLSANNSEVLSLKINVPTLDAEIFHFSQNRFDCNSSIDLDKSKFTPLKQILASLVKSNINQDDNLEFINKSYIYKLLYILTTYFRIEDNNSNYINKSSEKVASILNYVNDNFKRKISVDDLASSLYISKSYISKLFKKSIGLSFSEYLMEVRLSYAVKDLYNPNLKIEIIAEKNGFSNTRSFVTAFKNKYGSLPSIFRKETNNSSNRKKNNTKGINYLTLQHTNSFNKLADYLKEDNSIVEKNINSTRVYETSPIDVLAKSSLLKYTFKKLICIGKAKHILIFENREMLHELQKDIGFEYIRFHGLLDDDMMLYSEDEDGNSQLSFTYIDLVIDYILSIKLKPFIELSFMPRELAENPNRTMFFIHSIISLPKNMAKWTYMIEELTRHLIVRYGRKEVELWPFFLWNEPDVTDMFGFENRYDFFNFYKETYNAVKKINSSIPFGSPPVFGSTLEGSNDWIDTFMSFCKLNNCFPDFINTHFYPMNLNGGDSTSISKSSHIEMSKSLLYMESENALKETIQCIKKGLKKVIGKQIRYFWLAGTLQYHIMNY